MTYQNILTLVKKYILEVKKSGITVHEAYLFGSQAKKTADKNSDIDVCVVSSSFKGDRQSNRLQLMKITHRLSDDIEPHPLTIEDFNNPYDPFVKEVKKGVRID